MSKWRPLDWDPLNIYAGVESISTTPIDLIEAGADSMLDLLRKMGSEQQTAYQKLAELMGNAMSRGAEVTKGTLVRIPNDPEEDTNG